MILETPHFAAHFLRSYWKLVPLVLVTVAAVEFANDHFTLARPAFSLAAVGLVVSSFSVFLAFRMSESYGRWWEARKLWGDLVNSSRSFTRQVTMLVTAEGSDPSNEADVYKIRRALIYRQIAFVNALRISLRGQCAWDEIAPFINREEFDSISQSSNKPTQILQRQAEELAMLCRTSKLTEIGLLQFDRSLAALHDVQGACERIKKTPFPVNVSAMTRVIAWAMGAILAIAVMNADNSFDIVDMVVIPVLMLSFVLLERLGAELRNPFENEANDTPMSALCRSIEIDLREALGEKDVGEELVPVRGVVM